jgi:hypothetical protein
VICLHTQSKKLYSGDLVDLLIPNTVCKCNFLRLLRVLVNKKRGKSNIKSVKNYPNLRSDIIPNCMMIILILIPLYYYASVNNSNLNILT